MTVTEKDPFLAILAMDSYNRGGGAGINDGGAEDADGLGDAIGTKIGTATISKATDSDPLSPEVAAGFYSIAYETDYGTVISYRGTDSTPAADATTDATPGWPLGHGNATPALSLPRITP